MNSQNVAVGMALSGHPPHRSVRAELPHTAPTSDVDAHTAYCAASRTPSNPRDLRSGGFPSRIRLDVRPSSDCSVFSLVSSLPSIDAAGDGTSPWFADFCGTMELSDSSATCASGL